MAWSLDGRLATGANDGTVLLWDITPGQAEVVEPVVPSEEITGITGIAWSPRGYLTYSYGDAEGTMIVQDITGAVAPTILKNGRPVNAIAWSPPPAPALAAGLENGNVAIWTVNIAEGT